MANAIWLLLALPTWYFGAATVPFSSGALTLVPAIGSLSLVLGVIIGSIQRRRELLWFLALFAMSELLVVIAGMMRGLVNPMSGALNVWLYVFLGFQCALAGYLIYRIKGARASAAALGVFSFTYATAATFVAAMSFTDTWL